MYDAFNGDARQFLWDNLKAHYYDKNIRSFWLDADEGMGSVGEARPWPKTDVRVIAVVHAKTIWGRSGVFELSKNVVLGGAVLHMVAI